MKQGFANNSITFKLLIRKSIIEVDLVYWSLHSDASMLLSWTWLDLTNVFTEICVLLYNALFTSSLFSSTKIIDPFPSSWESLHLLCPLLYTFSNIYRSFCQMMQKIQIWVRCTLNWLYKAIMLVKI